MTYDPRIHHRHSIRLKGYDYARAGAYFVTIVAQDRACLFGAITAGEMHLNAAGQMVERWWHEIERKFPTVVAGEHITMPNHFHAIVVIVGDDLHGNAGTVGVDLRVDPARRMIILW